MDDDATVEALTSLGLTAYEAEVFLGLQKLGVGSAREVSEVTDVPRSQVYGAAEALAEYGLVDVQQGRPTRFRPVEVEAARERLYERLESTGDRAFEYLEGVRGAYEDADEASEAIWTVSGSADVAARAASLLDRADERAIYGTGDVGRLEPAVAEALEATAARGVDVVVASADEGVQERVEELPGVGVWPVPPDREPVVSVGRMLVCDRDTMLLSVDPEEGHPRVAEETAFWSAGGAFATALVTLVEEWFGGAGQS